jgi:ubiquinone/menaquinone biosynthesis C-methylase UbiE
VIDYPGSGKIKFHISSGVTRSQDKSTRRAFNTIPILAKRPLILDIGCGHGVHTIELAKISKGTVIALDDH